MKLRAPVAVVAGAICSALVIASAAWGAASTRITLNPGLDNPHGRIFSSSQTCLANRTVIAFMQKGSTQNPTVDRRMDTTKSSRSPGASFGQWDMGNPGFPKRKMYYVEATAKTGCDAAFSPTRTFIPFAGLPQHADCVNESVSALTRKYPGLDAAAADLEYPNAKALDDAVLKYCQ
jgi:hypothetical protein